MHDMPQDFQSKVLKDITQEQHLQFPPSPRNETPRKSHIVFKDSNQDSFDLVPVRRRTKIFQPRNQQNILPPDLLIPTSALEGHNQQLLNQRHINSRIVQNYDSVIDPSLSQRQKERDLPYLEANNLESDFNFGMIREANQNNGNGIYIRDSGISQQTQKKQAFQGQDTPFSSSVTANQQETKLARPSVRFTYNSSQPRKGYDDSNAQQAQNKSNGVAKTVFFNQGGLEKDRKSLSPESQSKELSESMSQMSGTPYFNPHKMKKLEQQSEVDENAPPLLRAKQLKKDVDKSEVKNQLFQDELFFKTFENKTEFKGFGKGGQKIYQANPNQSPLDNTNNSYKSLSKSNENLFLARSQEVGDSSRNFPLQSAVNVHLSRSPKINEQPSVNESLIQKVSEQAIQNEQNRLNNISKILRKNVNQQDDRNLFDKIAKQRQNTFNRTERQRKLRQSQNPNFQQRRLQKATSLYTQNQQNTHLNNAFRLIAEQIPYTTHELPSMSNIQNSSRQKRQIQLKNLVVGPDSFGKHSHQQNLFRTANHQEPIEKSRTFTMPIKQDSSAQPPKSQTKQTSKWKKNYTETEEKEQKKKKRPNKNHQKNRKQSNKPKRKQTQRNKKKHRKELSLSDSSQSSSGSGYKSESSYSQNPEGEDDLQHFLLKKQVKLTKDKNVEDNFLTALLRQKQNQKPEKSQNVPKKKQSPQLANNSNQLQQNLSLQQKNMLNLAARQLIQSNPSLTGQQKYFLLSNFATNALPVPETFQLPGNMPWYLSGYFISDNGYIKEPEKYEQKFHEVNLALYKKLSDFMDSMTGTDKDPNVSNQQVYTWLPKSQEKVPKHWVDDVYRQKNTQNIFRNPQQNRVNYTTKDDDGVKGKRMEKQYRSPDMLLNKNYSKNLPPKQPKKTKEQKSYSSSIEKSFNQQPSSTVYESFINGNPNFLDNVEKCDKNQNQKRPPVEGYFQQAQNQRLTREDERAQFISGKDQKNGYSMQGIMKKLQELSQQLHQELPEIKRQIKENKRQIQQLETALLIKGSAEKNQMYKLINKMKLKDQDLKEQESLIHEREDLIQQYKQELRLIKQQLHVNQQNKKEADRELWYEERLGRIRKYNETLCHKLQRDKEQKLRLKARKPLIGEIDDFDFLKDTSTGSEFHKIQHFACLKPSYQETSTQSNLQLEQIDEGLQMLEEYRRQKKRNKEYHKRTQPMKIPSAHVQKLSSLPQSNQLNHPYPANNLRNHLGQR